MIGAVGLVTILIPLSLIALIVVASYWRHGTGPYEFRRRSAIVYFAILVASAIAFASSLRFSATTFVSGSVLLVLTAVVLGGFVWPNFSTRLHSFLAKRTGNN
jgi:hypothetical protein